MRRVLSLFLAVSLLAGAARAAAAEPASATELARILMPRASWSEGIDQLAKAVQARMRGHPGSQLQYPADFAEKVRAEVEQILPYDDLVGIHAKELAAAYSPAEIDGLIAFYRGPLGQKTLQTMSQVSDKVAVATQQRVESKMGDAMKRLASHAKAPEGASAQRAAPELPPGHPPMGGAAPAKSAPASKGTTSKPRAKGDSAAKPSAAAPKASAPAPKAEGGAAAAKDGAPAAKPEVGAAAPKDGAPAAK